MANLDTVWKRASATISFPHAVGVWPSGAVDRQGAVWLYNGIAAASPSNPAYELFSAYSEITPTLDWLSRIWPTLARDSDITPTLDKDSRI